MEAVVSGVELIQRVVPREALSQLDCHRPIYIQHFAVASSLLWLKVGDDQGSSLGLRTAVFLGPGHRHRGTTQRRGRGLGFCFFCTEVHWSWTWSETAASRRSCHVLMETGWQVMRTKELNGAEGCARRTVKELYRVDVTEDP